YRRRLDAQCWLDRRDRPADRRERRFRGSPHARVKGTVLRLVVPEAHEDLLETFVAEVAAAQLLADNADDLDVGLGVDAAAQADAGADWIAVAEVASREILVDDDGPVGAWRRARCSYVARVEIASGRHPHAKRRDASGADAHAVNGP